MKKVVLVETFDGVRHETVKKAADHLQNLYGDALTKLGHKLAATNKYTQIMSVLQANLDLMHTITRMDREICSSKNFSLDNSDED